MAVANAWATGHSTVSISHFRLLRSSSSVDCCSANKSLDLSCSVQRRTFLLKTRKNSRLYCQCTANPDRDTNNCNSSSSSSSEWDWDRWTLHFSEIEQAENYASVLKFQLEEAIEKENFQEAAKLKAAITEASSKDNIAEIMFQLKTAIDEERYHDASRLCRSTGSGLVGWWVGCSKDSDDPFGRLIRITPGMGRFVARSYTLSQLLNASLGTPMFEIFIVKDCNEAYNTQIVFLRRAKGSSANTSSSNTKPAKGPSASVIDTSVIDVQVNENKAEKSDKKSVNFEATEEVIKSMINYFKDKIPELKVNVVNINVTEEAVEDADSLKQLMEENNDNMMSAVTSEDSARNLDEIQPDQVTSKGDGNAMEGKDSDTKLFIGGVIHNQEATPTKDEYMRVPAEIEDLGKDSFVLHIPFRSQDCDSEKNAVPKVKVAAIAAQGISELMPADVAKAFWNSDEISSKVSKDVREIVQLAVSQAQKREKLSEYTSFKRITSSSGDLDPFDGLYVGAFGPYGTEVVQLRCKYGNWEAKKSSDMEFFEYVEAVKLTGDLNVPTGQVTFCAKVGKGNRLSNQGIYPDELGVVASYQGQGRIAEFGFKNPKWVEGELLQLNGKGIGPKGKGADLGFLYVVPEQSFLVLFNRLRLPD